MHIYHITVVILNYNTQSICLNLAETYFAIKVFVDFLDHLFETKMSLWHSKLLHHMLQFLKVNEFISACVISTQIKSGLPLMSF